MKKLSHVTAIKTKPKSLWTKLKTLFSRAFFHTKSKSLQWLAKTNEQERTKKNYFHAFPMCFSLNDSFSASTPENRWRTTNTAICFSCDAIFSSRVRDFSSRIVINHMWFCRTWQRRNGLFSPSPAHLYDAANRSERKLICFSRNNEITALLLRLSGATGAWAGSTAFNCHNLQLRNGLMIHNTNVL